MKTALLLASLVVVACSKTAEPEASKPEPVGAAPSPAPSAQQSAASAAANGSEVQWDPAPSWKVGTNPSAMRKATYVIPRAPGDAEDADLSISQVGGGVDANIKRWGGQFQGGPPPSVSKRSVGSLTVTVVEAHGTFDGGGMPGMAATGPKKDWALLAAIVDATDPPYFFKMTGPKKTVDAARGDFDRFVSSFRVR